MTREERARLRALCAVSPPGPWLICGASSHVVEFIAAAREALPALLDALEVAEGLAIAIVSATRGAAAGNTRLARSERTEVDRLIGQALRGRPCRSCGAESGGTWGWGSSPEIIDGREDTRDEAIAAAREELGPGEHCWIFPEVHDVDPADYCPSAVDILDGAAADAYGELPDSMQDERWPDATSEQLAELDAFLVAWFRRIASPVFRSIAQSEEIIT